MSLSVNGLVSGLDTEAIVEGALALQQSRVDTLNLRKQEIVEEQAAFRTIEGHLLGLRGSLGGIIRSTNNAFDGKVATSSDDTLIDVSASSSAATGTYRMRVTQLAQAHQIATEGIADASDVGEGTLQIRVGNRGPVDLEIEAGTSLQSLADTINNLAPDVSAAVIDDGTADAPHRLIITSRHSGSENQIDVTSSLTGGLTFSGTPVQAAQDAQLTMGSGAGAITVTSDTNQFDDFLPGVSLDVLKVEDQEVEINIAVDTQKTVTAVQDFVDSYNTVAEFIGINSTYDTESETAGIFLGNRSAQTVQSRLRNVLSTAVRVGEDSGTTISLSTIGISTEDDGRLSLDSGRLRDILAGEVEEVSADDVRRLFAMDGQSSNPGVEFVLGTNDTVASPVDSDGNPLPYEVEITRAASAAQLTARRALPDTLVLSEIETLELSVDDADITIDIPAGSYSQQELAEQIQVLINTSSDRAGRQVEVSAATGFLEIDSQTIGAVSAVRILEGGDALGFDVGQTDVGTNVEGAFRVRLPNGDTIREDANGNGNLLSGDPDNKYTADMQVRSNLTESQIGAETDALLTVTRGVGAELDKAISELLQTETADQGDGTLASAQTRFDSEIANIDDDISIIENRIETRREALLRQYATLEATLAELQSVGDTLTSSLLATL